MKRPSALIAAIILACGGILWLTWSHGPPPEAPPLSSTITAGGSHMLAIDADGHIFGWGSGQNGELGSQDACFSRVPATMPGEPTWRSVHTGTRASYAIATDGTLWRRAFGRRGCGINPHLAAAYEPLNWSSRWLKVQEAFGIVAGLDEGRVLWFWKDFEVLPEAARDLGGRAEVTLAKASAPQQWQDFCLGINTIYAVSQEGTLWRNALAPKPSEPPSQTTELTRMVQIPAPVRFTRVFCRENGLHVLALDTQATLWGFGDNFFGELATGSGGGAQPRTAVIPETPIQRVTQKRWRDVAVGQGFTVAIAADGSLWSWGNNASAALGTGNQDNSSTPRLVDDRQRWAAVAAGEDSAMGLTAEGTLYTWGTNNDGALGDGVDTNVHATPTRVFGKQRWAVPAASRAVQPR